jgi:hypothetical protein
MPAQNIDQIKLLLDEIYAEDVAEDTEFQTQIDALSTSVAAVTAERDALQAEKATTLVELRGILDSLAARIAALESA